MLLLLSGPGTALPTLLFSCVNLKAKCGSYRMQLPVKLFYQQPLEDTRLENTDRFYFTLNSEHQWTCQSPRIVFASRSRLASNEPWYLNRTPLWKYNFKITLLWQQEPSFHEWIIIKTSMKSKALPHLPISDPWNLDLAAAITFWHSALKKTNVKSRFTIDRSEIYMDEQNPQAITK